MFKNKSFKFPTYTQMCRSTCLPKKKKKKEYKYM